MFDEDSPRPGRDSTSVLSDFFPGARVCKVMMPGSTGNASSTSPHRFLCGLSAREREAGGRLVRRRYADPPGAGSLRRKSLDAASWAIFVRRSSSRFRLRERVRVEGPRRRDAALPLSAERKVEQRAACRVEPRPLFELRAGFPSTAPGSSAARLIEEGLGGRGIPGPRRLRPTARGARRPATRRATSVAPPVSGLTDDILGQAISDVLGAHACGRFRAGVAAERAPARGRCGGARRRPNGRPALVLESCRCSRSRGGLFVPGSIVTERRSLDRGGHAGPTALAPALRAPSRTSSRNEGEDRRRPTARPPRRA